MHTKMSGQFYNNRADVVVERMSELIKGSKDPQNNSKEGERKKKV